MRVRGGSVEGLPGIRRGSGDDSAKLRLRFDECLLGVFVP